LESQLLVQQIGEEIGAVVIKTLHLALHCLAQCQQKEVEQKQAMEDKQEEDLEGEEEQGLERTRIQM
jgi:hypothetical protein